MHIHHWQSLEDASSGPYIEVRKVTDGSYFVSVSLAEGESLLTGQYPSAILAEQFGVREAERRGIETLNVVHTGDK